MTDTAHAPTEAELLDLFRDDAHRPPVCRAINCDCTNYAPGRSMSGYVQCAGCLHTAQVHQARKQIKQVKRGN